MEKGEGKEFLTMKWQTEKLTAKKKQQKRAKLVITLHFSESTEDKNI